MRRVEHHVIEKSHPQQHARDEMALASKTLWKLAHSHVRQSCIFHKRYLNNIATFHLLTETDASKALPSKVAPQILLHLHHAWTAFFEAMEVQREHPERFQGQPGLPRYRHRTRGRNLLLFELGCIWKAELRVRELAVSQLGRLGETKQQPSTVQQVRIVPKAGHDLIEGIFEAEQHHAEGLHPDLVVALDPGVTVLAALTANKPGFVPRLGAGKPLKAVTQRSKKQREPAQQPLAKGRDPRFPSHRFDRITPKRTRRVMHYLHTASRRIVDLLVAEGIGTLVLGKTLFWKTRVDLGKKHTQEFVHIPHATCLDLLTYKAEALGMRVLVTEESSTRQASFLDLDPLPPDDPMQGAEQEERPRFSGVRVGRWYRVKGRPPLHAEIHGSCNIGRKGVPTAFGKGDRGHRSSAASGLPSKRE